MIRVLVVDDIDDIRFMLRVVVAYADRPCFRLDGGRGGKVARPSR
jgi:hypothetical protein